MAHRMVGVGYRIYNTMGYGHTVRLAWAIEYTIRWGMGTPCGWRELSNVQCDEVMAHRMAWWRLVGVVPVCPPESPHKGSSIVHSPHTMHVFLVWKRRYANVRTGTQAPPLRFRLGGLRMDGFVCWLVETVHMNQHRRCCTFVSPGLIERSEIYPG